MPSRWTARLTIALFWALIYLPGLGDLEIKGEEWRRTLLGRNMLQNGDWLVPRSGGMPYFKKPPLINWTSAISFKATGVVNEWTARLPSVLTALVGALGMFEFARRGMGTRGAFVGVLFFLTSVGLLEKGRIAEIEVYYMVFTGLAFASWLGGFLGKASRWSSWVWTGVFLGLGMLAKGPAHLLFFYLPVLGACWKTRRWRELVSLPHITSLLIILAMILAWAIPFISAYAHLMGISHADVLGSWGYEVSSRVTGEEKSSLSDWLIRGPKAVVMFLPWVLLLPLWWKKPALEAALPEPLERKTFSGLVWGVLAGYAVMVLIPSSSARYVAPLLAPVMLMLAWVVAGGVASLSEKARSWWFQVNRAFLILGAAALLGGLLWFRPDLGLSTVAWALTLVGAAALTHRFSKAVGPREPAALAQVSTLAAALLMGAFVWIGHPIMSRNESIRKTARSMAATMAEGGGRILVFHMGQIPYPFYFPMDTVEADTLDAVPQEEDFRWMLTPVKTDQDFRVWFERRFGTAETVAIIDRTWGREGDRGEKMIIVKFAGRDTRRKG